MKWTRKSRRWQLQEAKAKLSQLIELAESEGDQTITRRGKPVAVIVSKKRHEQITGAAKRPGIVEAFLSMPRVPGFKIPDRDKRDIVPKGPPLFG